MTRRTVSLRCAPIKDRGARVAPEMTKTMVKAAALVALLVLAGCGANGAPEPPPDSAQAQAAERGENVDTSRPERPKRELFIDGLL